MENLESQIHNKDCELLRLVDIFLERDKQISKLRTENKKQLNIQENLDIKTSTTNIVLISITFDFY